jgi:hypothetical protein
MRDPPIQSLGARSDGLFAYYIHTFWAETDPMSDDTVANPPNLPAT